MATLLKHTIGRCQKLLALLLLLSTCQAPEFPKPKITSIDPPEAIPGTLIEIKGEVLNTVTEVLFGGIGTREFWMHDTKNDVMNVFVPREAKAGKVDVMLKSPQGSSSPYQMTILPLLPTIIRIEPLSARTGQTITIIGENFTSDTKVSFPKGAKVDGNFIASSVLTVKIPEGEISGMMFLSNQLGTSKDGYPYDIVDPNSSKPIVEGMEPVEPFVGEPVVIRGKNFFANETTVSLSGRKLEIPTELTVFSTTEIRFTVPALATSGPLVVENSFGALTTNLLIQMTPVIERILPKSNARGGPIIIYGTNLKNVEQIQVGSAKMLKPEFAFIKDNMGRDVLYGRVPTVAAGNRKVKVGNLRGVVSKDFDFKVNAGELPIPPGFTGITYPNALVPPTLFTMGNNWGRNVGTGRLPLNDGATIGIDLKTIIDPLGDPNSNESTLGYFTKDGNQIFLRIDTTHYEGRLDSKFGNGNPPFRLVLTPVWAGPQVELVFPFGLDGASPGQLKKGGVTVLSGKYFYNQDGFVLRFDNTTIYDVSLSPDPPNFKLLSPYEIEVTIPADATKGVHNISVLLNELSEEPSNASNSVSVTVTN